ncbi:MAG: dihydrodipicolinate synthase family protein, partial [Lentisphaerae bacterium]|nr:dihydrodipicolinate synthase family protein [Lentisphaerota bacterium]
MIDHSWVRHSLTGPVSSLRTPFRPDGNIDVDGLRQQIDFNVEAGSRTMLLTAGDSHYIALSDEDIAYVTQVTVEHTDGRAMVVAAERYFSTSRAIDFADHCKGIGVDILMLMPPDWAGSCTPETLTEHYAAVAEHIPVMVVTNVFSPRGEAFGLRTCELALQTSDNIVAIKDDMCGPFARKMGILVHDKWAVIAGGQKQNHLNAHPYGCDGYLSTFITFKPEIAHRYWAAIESDDLSQASHIVRD